MGLIVLFVILEPFLCIILSEPIEKASQLFGKSIKLRHGRLLIRFRLQLLPEVDIVDIWRQTTQHLVATGSLSRPVPEDQLPQLAVDYETRVNPVWPMVDVEQYDGRIVSVGLTCDSSECSAAGWTSTDGLTWTRDWYGEANAEPLGHETFYRDWKPF